MKCILHITDFTGEPIFIGLDVHKMRYSVMVCYDGREYKNLREDPIPRTILKYLNRN